MVSLMERIRGSNQAFQDELARARTGDRTARRLSQDQINDQLHRNTVQHITIMLDELSSEEGFLHDACILPILSFLQANVPDELRRSTPSELDFADLDSHVDTTHVAVIFEFVLDRVQEYAAERPDPALRKEQARLDATPA